MAGFGFVVMIPALCAVPWLVWLGIGARAALAHMEVFNPLPRWEKFDRRGAEIEEARHD